MNRQFRVVPPFFFFVALSFAGLAPSVRAQQISSKVENINTLTRNGDTEGVKKAFEADAALLVGNARAQPLLLNALQNGKPEVVKYLLDQKLDPNAETYGNLPLSSALNYWGPEWKAMADLLVAKGVKVNAVSSQGETALTNLLRYGSNLQKEKIVWLLANGADIYQPDREGTTTLEQVFLSASPDVASLLIDKADVKRADGNGFTPLFFAVRSNKPDYVKQLLDKGSDVNARDAAGNTPLHLAAKTPGPLIKTLLDAGARTDIKNLSGDLALHIALRRAEDPTPNHLWDGPGAGIIDSEIHSAALAPLIEKSDINARDHFGISPLLLTLLARDQDARDLVVARHPRMDATTQLFDAVSQGNVSLVKPLITQKPFLVYFRLPDGSTPLHLAALWGTLGAAQYLVQKGADVSSRDAQGQTPLLASLENSNGIYGRRAKGMISFLLGKGASADAMDANLTTALHRAVRDNAPELIDLLLAHKVNLNVRDKWGYTPIFALMTKEGDSKSAEKLIGLGADVNVRPLDSCSLLSRAALVGRLDLVKLLVDKGADVKATNEGGMTALGQMVNAGVQGDDTVEIAKILLAKGSDPNERVGYETMISRIISNDSKPLLQVLLAAKGIDLKASMDRESPLVQAINYGRNEMVTMLLDAGANPNEMDDQGQTPALLAAQRSKEMGDLFKPKLRLLVNRLDFQKQRHGRIRSKQKDRRSKEVVLVLAPWILFLNPSPLCVQKDEPVTCPLLR